MSKSYSTSNASNPTPPPSRLRTAAAILAGGRAKRFGGGLKPLLQLPNGKTILENLICEVRKCNIESVVLSTNTPAPFAEFGIPAIADARPGSGPCGGIASVIENLENSMDTVLFVPGDAPAFTSAVGTALLEALKSSLDSVPAVFAEADGTFHPTFAAVRTNALEIINEQLDCGVRKMMDVWDDIGAHPVEFDDPTPFTNINTEEEWQNYQGMT